MFLISEIRPAPPTVGHAKRTVKRTAWPVGRFKRAGVGNPTRHDLRAVARVLGPFWAVGLFPWTVGNSAASMVHRKIAGTQSYRVIPPIFRDSCCSAQNRRGQELGTGARTMFLTNICTKIDIMFYLQKNFKKFII